MVDRRCDCWYVPEDIALKALADLLQVSPSGLL